MHVQSGEHGDFGAVDKPAKLDGAMMVMQAARDLARSGIQGSEGTSW
jgi:hypothetical protein